MVIIVEAKVRDGCSMVVICVQDNHRYLIRQFSVPVLYESQCAHCLDAAFTKKTVARSGDLEEEIE